MQTAGSPSPDKRHQIVNDVNIDRASEIEMKQLGVASVDAN